MTKNYLIFYILLCVSAPSLLFSAETIEIDAVEITSIKQGLNIKQEAVSSSVFSQEEIEKNSISGLKDLAVLAPNVFVPDYGSRITSSVYVRGLGARIDHPVMGMNVDNVPLLNKDNFDFEMVDVDRIEVLRGPQSAMYGRNTMGGVMNVYTISPLQWQGTRFGLDYGTANTLKARASHYRKANPYFGYAVTGYYSQTDGYFTNLYNDEKLDWEKQGGLRGKIHYKKGDINIQNTLSSSLLSQGGYPYKLIGSEGVDYNDPSSFERFTLTNALSVSKNYENFSIHSATSYSQMHNHMILDNDFTSENYFTLEQIQDEYTLTQDFVVKSNTESRYSWLVGGFAFFEYNKMEAPVLFKETGIQELIVNNANNDPVYNYVWGRDSLLLESYFNTPTLGAALYHKSSYSFDRLTLSGEVRVDYEYATLNYQNYAYAEYSKVLKDESKTLYPNPAEIINDESISNSFIEFIPKLSLTYSLKNRGTLYATVAKGYKAGGFNTQVFSDILKDQLTSKIMGNSNYDVGDVVTYDPEYSWNYELGGNFYWSELGLRASAAVFFIDCYDQQLTVLADADATGRIMTNAGRTKSQGVELSAAWSYNNFNLSADYGYTNAKFKDYKDFIEDDNGDDVEVQYAGNYVPYAPQHTASLRADYTVKLTDTQSIVFGLAAKGIGKIYWSEDNSIYEPFYTLLDAKIGYRMGRYSVDVWAKNILNTSYNTFYFESIYKKFVQMGDPVSAGISINIKL